MARRYRATFRNPYLDVNETDSQQEARFHVSIVMDEARGRTIGNLRAKKGAFELRREQLIEQRTGKRPDSARFQYNLERDFRAETITPASLESMKYSPSYRPSGRVGEQITDVTVSHLKYTALAGRKVKPPKDLSFISDPEARRARQTEERSPSLRRDVRRLDSPVDKRRAELLEMLPPEQQEHPEEIVQEVNDKRSKREKALGKIIRPREHKKRFDEDDFSVLLEGQELTDPTAEFRQRELDERTREEVVPKQDGMEESTQQLPDFYSETRNWSSINSENPTWSEIQQATITHVPKPKGKKAAIEGRFVPDEQFDPSNRYRPMPGVAPRRAPTLYLNEDYDPLEIENPYASDRLMSSEQIRGILARSEHGPGTLTVPEELTRPELLGAWYDSYSERFRPEQDRQQIDAFRERYQDPRSRYRGLSSRPEPPVRQPDRRRQTRRSSQAAQMREEEMRERYMRAQRDGVKQGREQSEEMRRKEQEAQAAAAQRQYAQMYARMYGQVPQQYTPQAGVQNVQRSSGVQLPPPRKRQG